jgi:hypothetical protein
MRYVTFARWMRSGSRRMRRGHSRQVRKVSSSSASGRTTPVTANLSMTRGCPRRAYSSRSSTSIRWISPPSSR